MPTKQQRKSKWEADFTVHQPERLPSPVKSPKKEPAPAVPKQHANAQPQLPLTSDPEDWHRHLNAIKKQDLEAAMENNASAFHEADAAYQEALQHMSQAHEKLVKSQAHAYQLGKQRQRIQDECSQLDTMYTSLLGEPLLEEIPKPTGGNKAQARGRAR